jgi:protocatechuate 3,4-dioxygenase beta subunit
LTLSGWVTDVECNPIPGAIVEIWHAEPTTKTPSELTAADSAPYDNSSSEMKYRGQMAADSEGRYSFHTKKPGWYLNGGTFRPSHIHVKIWVEGEERLTTQLYFEGDPFIPDDPWATAERSVSTTIAEDGSETGRFDFAIA